MRLVLTSDTHLPKRARDLPPLLWAAIDEADVVVHAGDWVDVATLDALSARARRLIACYGNNDGPGLRARLPEVAYASLDGLRLAVVHETGPAQRREERCAARFPDVDLLVFGQLNMPKPTTRRWPR
jgi:putative phosphoesterase